MQPYKEELKELEGARDRFSRRSQHLLDEVEGENLSEEQQQVRLGNLVEQFDMTARWLLRKTDKDIARWQPIFDAPAGARSPEDRERAHTNLERARKFRGLVLSTRAAVSGEDERDDF
jgi:hypothetical protein